MLIKPLLCYISKEARQQGPAANTDPAGRDVCIENGLVFMDTGHFHGNFDFPFLQAFEKLLYVIRGCSRMKFIQCQVQEFFFIVSKKLAGRPVYILKTLNDRIGHYNSVRRAFENHPVFFLTFTQCFQCVFSSFFHRYGGSKDAGQLENAVIDRYRTVQEYNQRANWFFIDP